MWIQTGEAGAPRSSTGPLFPQPIVSVTTAQIRVVTTADRQAHRHAWTSRLPPEQRIELRTTLPVPTVEPNDGLHEPAPELLLLDEVCLHEMDEESLRSIDARPGHVRLMLMSDDCSDSAMHAVFRHRMEGVLLSSAEPDVWMKACEAVCRGDLWLPRAWLSRMVRDVLFARPQVGARGKRDAEMRAGDGLSRRQDEIVALLRQGCSNKQIAHRLDIKEDTVKKHLQNIYAKLGVHRRALVALGGPSN